MNRYADYLFDTLEECCENYYPWNVRGCIEPEPVDTALIEDPCAEPSDEVYWFDIYDESYTLDAEQGYYPVYNSDTEYCVDDGNAPAYMLASPDTWLHQSLAACCLANFQWVFRECMGDIYGIDGVVICPSSLPLSGKWYAAYYDEDGTIDGCVKECEGAYPCYGRASSYKELYDSFEECCVNHFWWQEDSPCRGDFGGL
jgi:hypothetical protein